MAVELSKFLWRKYNERQSLYARHKKKYTFEAYADDIGIKSKTLTSIMNKEASGMIAFETMQAFSKFFGDEFSHEFDFQTDGVTGWEKTQPKFDDEG